MHSATLNLWKRRNYLWNYQGLDEKDTWDFFGSMIKVGWSSPEVARGKDIDKKTLFEKTEFEMSIFDKEGKVYPFLKDILEMIKENWDSSEDGMPHPDWKSMQER